MRGGFRAPVSARYFSNFPVGGAETGSISNRDRFVKSLADHHLIFYQRRDRMQSPPADDMAIVELLLIDRTAAFLGIAKDRPADRRYPGDQRGYVIDEGHEGMSLGHGTNFRP
jgi:hypothetical protein